MTFDTGAGPLAAYANDQLKQLTDERAPILQQLSEGVIIAGTDGRLIFVNAAAERLHGVKQLDIAPDDYSDTYSLFTMDGQPYPFEDLPLARAVARGETIVDARWRIRRPDGSEVVAIGSARPLMADGGQIGSILNVRDDSERFEGERKLRESEERLRLVIDAATDYAIFTTDLDRTITSWSKGAENIFHFTAAEAIGRCADELWTADDRQKKVPEKEVETALATGCANDERWHQRSDGSRVFLNGSVHPLPLDEEGRQRGVIKIARDETARHAAAHALTHSQEQTKLVLDNTASAFYSVDRDGDTTLVSRPFLDMMGFTDESHALGHKLHNLIHHTHPDGSHYPVEECPIYQCASAATPAHVPEEMFFRLDGTPVPVEYWVAPIMRGDEHIGATCTIIDLTQRKAAETALRESEERYRTLFEAIEAGFCIIEMEFGADGRALDYRFIEVNPAFAAQTGLVDATGKSIKELVPDLEQHWFDIYGEVAKTRTPLRFENGAAALAERWFDVYAFPTGAPESNRVAILFTDISDRKRADVIIQESEARFRNMADHAPVMMWVTEPDGYCSYLNRGWYEFTGQSEDEALGLGWLKAVHPDDTAQAERAFIEANHEAAPFRVDYRLRRADGAYRWAIDTAAPRFGADGQFLGFVGSVIDIHERREAENVLANLNDTLERRVEEEVAQRTEAEEALRQSQKMETLGQLTGGIAHDFNNLLQIITGNLDILRRTIPADSPRLQRSVENAFKGAERAAILTQRLLAFSRRQPLVPKVFLPNKLVSGMSELLHRAIGETVAIETVLGSGLWRVEADSNQLETALLNLAINSRDAMPDGGKLTIETANTRLDRSYAEQNSGVLAGQYVAICVSDTGTGMDAVTAERAFDPFFTTKEVGKGTGLGLSMVYGFVKQSGGHLKIYSELGEGTTIKIYLPRHHGEEAEVEDKVYSNFAPQGIDGETILVCEDDDDVRAYSVQSLRELGYHVIEAADGASALRLLEKADGGVDLLFTDIVLPGGMTGAMVAEGARKIQPGLKVLFTTGYARNAIVHHGRLDPGVELLSKPFSYADLAARVRDMLDARQGQA